MTATLRLLGPPYRSRSQIRIAAGSRREVGVWLRRTTNAQRVLLVTDSRVNALYGPGVRRSLARAGLGVSLLVLSRGERTKRAALLERVWSACAKARIARRDAIVALGGGVIGDLAGLAAATWLRGVAWLAVPTTLLAQVDSSVGGKTAIDVPAGKNLVGAFHAPSGVVIDAEVLATLPVRERRSGLAEIVKSAIIADAALFRWLERNARDLAAGEPRALAIAIERTVRLKARIVASDEREREGGARTALNFGHTLGHALEAALGYRQLRHGEAVAIGMRAAARLSREAGRLAPAEHDRIIALLDTLRLPARMPAVTLRALTAAMAHDKKGDVSGVRWVLTPQIGHASVPRLLPGRLVRAALLAVGARP